jgi:hypothetical protein
VADSDWYRNKLASLRGNAPNPPQRAPYQPQQFTGQSNYTQPNQMQPIPQHYQPPQPPQEPVTIHNLWGAMHFWHGGKAHQIDREPCPECGSNQYYSRAGGARRGPPPAPHCYNCGYNGGLFEQGDPTTWGATTN